jgi:ubiquinone/menaquinone biosynthesis C-methylase UbiE
MANQKGFWNNFHKKRIIDKFSEHPTDFAKKVIKFFPNNANVLELGCGLANDSIFFAENDFEVLATDFSEFVIKEAEEKFSNGNPEFEVLDIKDLSKFKDNSFDVVYARLSLHYFTDTKTKKIFMEINRILKNKGLLCFICKSTRDPLYGKGQMIEKDMFNDRDHIRHFFSEEYTRSLLNDIFKIKTLTLNKEDLYGHESGFIEVIARKK